MPSSRASSIRKPCSHSGRCRSSAKMKRFRESSPSTPKNARIATAWKKFCRTFAMGKSKPSTSCSRICRPGKSKRPGSAAAIMNRGSTTQRPSNLPGSICWSCKICSIRRCGDVATYQVARGGFRRRDRLVCEFRRPAAIVRLGHPPAARRVGRRAIVLGAARQARTVQRPAVLSEVAAEIIAFSAAVDEIPLVGIDLRVNQLAMATP